MMNLFKFSRFTSAAKPHYGAFLRIKPLHVASSDLSLDAFLSTLCHVRSELHPLVSRASTDQGVCFVTVLATRTAGSPTPIRGSERRTNRLLNRERRIAGVVFLDPNRKKMAASLSAASTFIPANSVRIAVRPQQCGPNAGHRQSLQFHPLMVRSRSSKGSQCKQSL